MKLSWATLVALTIIVVLSFVAYYTSYHGDEVSSLTSVAEWQRMASPGELSKAHSFLSHNCNACHTPVKGVEAVNCIACHANNESLLKRQPTSFHANIGSCVECHTEHQGSKTRLTQMDHNALTSLGLQQLRSFSNSNDEDERLIIEQVTLFLEQNESKRPTLLVNPHLSSKELTLRCASCHQNKTSTLSYLVTIVLLATKRLIGAFLNLDTHPRGPWIVLNAIKPHPVIIWSISI